MLISPAKAGVESVVRNMLKFIPPDNVKLYLISSSEIANYYEGLIPRSRHLVLGSWFGVPSNKYLRWIKRYIDHKFDLKAKKLRRWSVKTETFLDQHQIKIIHANLVWDYYIASELRRRRADIKYINTMHGTLSLDPADNYDAFFPRAVILKFLSNVDVFVSACQYFFDLLHLWQIETKQATLIPNGIDIEIYQDRGLTVENDKVVISFFGGGRPEQKGGDLLMHAVYLLVTEFQIQNFELQVFGHVTEDGKERELARYLGIASHIKWKGFVAPPRHLTEMRASDIFVLPSRHEGVANTLMEAIGCGIAIVASKVGGTPEVIDDGKNGLLCYPDARDLASKLAILIKDKSLRMKLADANEKLKHQYKWEEICLKYEQLYLTAGL